MVKLFTIKETFGFYSKISKKKYFFYIILNKIFAVFLHKKIFNQRGCDLL